MTGLSLTPIHRGQVNLVKNLLQGVNKVNKQFRLNDTEAATAIIYPMTRGGNSGTQYVTYRRHAHTPNAPVTLIKPPVELTFSADKQGVRLDGHILSPQGSPETEFYLKRTPFQDRSKWEVLINGQEGSLPLDIGDALFRLAGRTAVNARRRANLQSGAQDLPPVIAYRQGITHPEESTWHWKMSDQVAKAHLSDLRLALRETLANPSRSSQ